MADPEQDNHDDQEIDQGQQARTPGATSSRAEPQDAQAQRRHITDTLVSSDSLQDDDFDMDEDDHNDEGNDSQPAPRLRRITDTVIESEDQDNTQENENLPTSPAPQREMLDLDAVMNDGASVNPADSPVDPLDSPQRGRRPALPRGDLADVAPRRALMPASLTSSPSPPGSPSGASSPPHSPRRNAGNEHGHRRRNDSLEDNEMDQGEANDPVDDRANHVVAQVAQMDLDDQDGEEAVIFGTTVQVQAAIASFRKFLDTFRKSDADAHGEPYYRRRLTEIHETRNLVINIDCEDLYTSDLEFLMLYKKLVQYPNEMIPALDLAVYQQFITMFPDDPTLESGERIQVRTFNLHKLSRMRQLDPEDIDMIVALRGMVVRVSPVIPDMKTAKFRCTLCNAEAEASIDRGVIEEPTKCPHCTKSHVMQLNHNLCLFSDKQMVKLQEAPENIPEGETPQTISMYAYDGLVDVAKPGDRVEVTAIFRASAVRKIATRRTTQAIYKTFLDVLHFRPIQKGANLAHRDLNLETIRARLARRAQAGQGDHDDNSRARRRLHGNDDNEEEDNDDIMDRDDDSSDGGDDGPRDADGTALIDEAEQEAVFREMAADPDIYSKLAHSVAPSIWELDDIKKGVLLQLMGGTNKEASQQAGEVRSSHRMRSRGEINVLLCGDPGTSKSQILGYVHKLAPRGIYTSGKGSSAVGLTAYITKDPDTKEHILESGALVLSDRGVCCIDEFDKMSDTTRAILHECMEQQTISIAKAGIIATLNARTSILASANPVESRYNPRLSIVQNIQLPPTLLSRFDLIYLVLDKPDPSTDRRLARHLVQLYFRNPVARGALVDRTTLRAYIAYCRRKCFPQISNSAVRKLVQGYVEMRQAGSYSNGKKTISATPRQLESLIRLAEAHAKLHLCDVVTETNVDEALRLMHVATQTAAVDPRTGTIDMDAITTGVGATDRALNEALGAELLALIPGEGIRAFALTSKMNEQASTPVTQEQVMKAVHSLVDDGKAQLDLRSGLIRPQT
ncbi:DNA replication licensing factor, putative [Hondaea fermentalgiana]|uniref:DNA helicase n=1 Tax=Hondaea fermentalgiana TaxID=2315210 RepID=A0A2R5FZ17_9STRA|nr:DNA replication licensing factor, putative [Hondaea fermentalgiana]|eukprot:GBG23997.1 DNA replication licensing factor, putative [Hondaea fermentalgiana]